MTSQEIGTVALAAIALGGGVYAVAVGVSHLVFKRRLHELEIAMARYPNYADVRAQLAALYYSHGYIRKAKQYYYEALKVYPFYLYARLKLALVCAEANEPDEALWHFRRIRIDAAEDPNMRRLVEDLMREKGLMEAYLRDPAPGESDDLYAHRLLS